MRKTSAGMSMSRIIKKGKNNRATQSEKAQKKKKVTRKTGWGTTGAGGDDGESSAMKSVMSVYGDKSGKSGKSCKSGKVDKPKPVKPQRKRKKLHIGEIVAAPSGRQFETVHLLGSGGFGDVYKVKKRESKDGEWETGVCYALKTEDNDTEEGLSLLKIEAKVLGRFRDLKNESHKKHFICLVDLGKTAHFKFVVMPIVGLSLEDLRKDLLQHNFSRSTVMKIAQQTLEALRDLHALGIIHRDIKPQNFCVGLAPKEETIYMLDFGISREWYDPKTKAIRIPRKRVKFKGTIPFASRACHKEFDQGKKDDVEAWLYLMIDVFDDAAMPWKKTADRNAVLNMKEHMFNNNLPTVLPADFARIFTYIDKLQYADEPDYPMMFSVLEDVYKNDTTINASAPLDWSGKLDAFMANKEKEDLIKALQAKERDAKEIEEDKRIEAKEEKKRKKKERKNKAKAGKKKDIYDADDDDDGEDDSDDEDKDKDDKKDEAKEKKLEELKHAAITATPPGESPAKEKSTYMPA